jgi:hypothetical protein
MVSFICNRAKERGCDRMSRKLAVLVLALLVVTFGLPLALADTGAWLDSSVDKEMRGLENGLFGMGGEIYHHVSVRGEKGPVEAWTMGLLDGIARGTVRTLVGVYEIATPWHHDEPVLSDLDTVLKTE